MIRRGTAVGPQGRVVVGALISLLPSEKFGLTCVLKRRRPSRRKDIFWTLRRVD
jgi:hypothetical protein